MTYSDQNYFVNSYKEKQFPAKKAEDKALLNIYALQNFCHKDVLISAFLGSINFSNYGASAV